jgi:hypothetical protein
MLVVMVIICRMFILGAETRVWLASIKLFLKKIFCRGMIRRENSRKSALKKFKKVANRLRFFLKLGFGKKALEKKYGITKDKRLENLKEERRGSLRSRHGSIRSRRGSIRSRRDSI